MTYRVNAELPDVVKKYLPQHAQRIYREAYNQADEQYEDTKKQRDPEMPKEEICLKVAWAAVEQTYEKGEDGHWYLKNQNPKNDNAGKKEVSSARSKCNDSPVQSRDKVDEASWESFPASDPPAWIHPDEQESE